MAIRLQVNFYQVKSLANMITLTTKHHFYQKDLLLKKHYQKHLDMDFIDTVFTQSELRLDMTLMENHFFHFQK